MANNSSAADARASSLESIDLCLSVTCPCSCFFGGNWEECELVRLECIVC
jgi:hypothetical protein